MLLDVMMPDISGIEVLQQVRLERSPSELPIIMVTAKTGTEDTVNALELGANDYLSKPIDFPICGIFRGPKSSRATTKIKINSGIPRGPNT